MEALGEIADRIDKERRSNVENLIDSIKDISKLDLIPLTDFNQLPVIEKLRYASKADIPRFVDDFLESFENTSKESFIFIYYIFMDLLLSASKIIEELGGNAKEVLSEYFAAGSMLSDNTGLERIRTLLTSVLESVIDYRDTITGSKYQGIISKAQEYIINNYSDKDITLHSVAREVNISPNHFSTIFSKETGETFISYVTKVRLDKAKVLLKTTQMRTSDISYEVGYNDTHYFSYVFKKHNGMTPKEFRNK